MSNNKIYTATSPYYLTDITNGKFLDFMVNRPIPPVSTDLYYTLTSVYNYRPDLLAFDLYNEPRLWWVFAARNPNRLKDPLFDFVSGLSIYVPKAEYLKQVLGF
jgi:alpha-L-fucosidase